MHHHTQFTWTNWIPVLFILIIGLCYLYSFYYLLKKEKKWSIWQLFSFLSGITLLTIAMLPSVMSWGHSDMRGHMVQHLLIAMYAPIFLVLGAPLTLALKTLPPKISRKIVSFLKTKFFQYASHPVTAFLLNIGGMYVLYLTTLYNESFNNPLLHHFIHLHFFAAGYLFTWSIIGPDAAPNRPGFSMRLTVLFFSIAAHGFLSKLMYAHILPKNSPHNDFQIKEGAKLMYYWGDLSEIILIIVLFSFWYYNKKWPKQNLTLIRK